MGGRYLVTGTQLGMLETMDSSIDRHKLIYDVIDKQFLATSGCNIETDVNNIKKYLEG